ncbi:RiboL-PSP-HEPN domain-containing protein [Candidatus Magnetomoraceae bacterium gMMP-15]
MDNRIINRELQKFNDLLNKTKELRELSIEIQSHWAKYLCVYTAGFIENSVKEIFMDFVNSSASSPVSNYANSILRKIQNPKSERIVQITRSFKKSWGKKLKQFISEENRGDAIDSIMQNRHLIAHGKYSGITVARVSQYMSKAIEVLEYTEKLCNNEII